MSEVLKINQYNESQDAILNLHPKELQSLFNLFNGKPDSTMKIFPRDVIIDVADLFNLKEKMDEKLNHFKGAIRTESIHIRFENNKFKDFSSWNEFERCNWTSSNIIESIVLKWDFLIKLDEYGIPQRHTVAVRLSSEMKPEHLFQMMINGKIDDLDSIDKNLAPVICSVSFVDHLISEEIINIVDEWNKGLAVGVSKKGHISFFQKHKMKVATLIKTITKFSGISIIVLMLCLLLSKFDIEYLFNLTINQLQIFIMALGASFLAYELISRSAYSKARSFLEKITSYGETFTFNITKGDTIRQNEIQKNNERKQKDIYSSIILNVIINVSCGVIATILYNLISIN